MPPRPRTAPRAPGGTSIVTEWLRGIFNSLLVAAVLRRLCPSMRTTPRAPAEPCKVKAVAVLLRARTRAVKAALPRCLSANEIAAAEGVHGLQDPGSLGLPSHPIPEPTIEVSMMSRKHLLSLSGHLFVAGLAIVLMSCGSATLHNPDGSAGGASGGNGGSKGTGGTGGVSASGAGGGAGASGGAAGAHATGGSGGARDGGISQDGPGLSANGVHCTTGSSCMSGICVDGVCCNDTCTGQCQSCSES